jgi:hypothetical protein
MGPFGGICRYSQPRASGVAFNPPWRLNPNKNSARHKCSRKSQSHNRNALALREGAGGEELGLCNSLRRCVCAVDKTETKESRERKGRQKRENLRTERNCRLSSASENRIAKEAVKISCLQMFRDGLHQKSCSQVWLLCGPKSHRPWSL